MLCQEATQQPRERGPTFDKWRHLCHNVSPPRLAAWEPGRYRSGKLPDSP